MPAATLDGKGEARVRLLCLHGHFYQPPREHPWLGVVEPQPSARPYRDWNVRVTAECYAPNTAARVLDARGRIVRLVNTYERLSFNVGPTLLAWLEREAPAIYGAIVAADRAGRGALAQPYSHPIMPLSTPRDRRTQLRWGVRDFEHRFGRRPAGIWLPEMAVDRDTLVALAEAGIGFTILSPHQARRVRPLGAGEEGWRDVSGASLDTGKLYRCVLGDGLAVDIAFRDAELSHEVAFGDLLRDGAWLARRLAEAVGGGPQPRLLTVAVDGETFGHHHRFGEMALAFALGALEREEGLVVGTVATFRSLHPPGDEVEIAERTSWSCAHGVERWRTDCGCHVGGEPGWSQAWRGPLRLGIDWLREQVESVYLGALDGLLRDPWGARERYIDCLLEPARLAGFLRAEAGHVLGEAEYVRARRALEMARHALLMQTSCGWFFDELTGLEPLQVLAYAGRAIELAGRLGRRLEEGFCERLAEARSNLSGKGSGADIFRALLRDLRADAPRVAAHAVMVRHVLDEESAAARGSAAVPGHRVVLSEERRLALPSGSLLLAIVSVAEEATGERGGVAVASLRAAGKVLRCRVAEGLGREDLARLAGRMETRAAAAPGAALALLAGRELTVSDLFLEGRLAVLARLARDAERAVGEAARQALAEVGPLVEEWLRARAPLPPQLARAAAWVAADDLDAALGRVAAGAPVGKAVAVLERARALGLALDLERVGRRLGDLLEGSVAAAVCGDERAALRACALLDLGSRAGATLDLWGAQNRVYAACRGDKPPPPWLAALGERLGLALD